MRAFAHYDSQLGAHLRGKAWSQLSAAHVVDKGYASRFEWTTIRTTQRIAWSMTAIGVRLRHLLKVSSPYIQCVFGPPTCCMLYFVSGAMRIE
jgi:hypothetical protein